MTDAVYATIVSSKQAFVFVFDAFESTAVVSIVALAIETTGRIDTSAIRITIVDLLGTFVNFSAALPIASVPDIAQAVVGSLILNVILAFCIKTN